MLYLLYISFPHVGSLIFFFRDKMKPVHPCKSDLTY